MITGNSPPTGLTSTFQGSRKNPSAFTLRFGEKSTSEEPTPKPRRPRPLLEKAGLAVATAGLALGLGLGAKANIDYDGKFDLIPVNAEEKYQQGIATIPGIIVLGLGRFLIELGRGRRKNKPEAKK